jgi:hypothetical protein
LLKYVVEWSENRLELGLGPNWEPSLPISADLPVSLGGEDYGFLARPSFADLDGDLDPDLVLGKSWVRNDSGTFVPQSTDDACGLFAAAAVAANLDGDAYIDMVFVAEGGVLAYCRNLDGGTTWDGVALADIALPAVSSDLRGRILAADLDGDGLQDVVAALAETAYGATPDSRILWWRNPGTPPPWPVETIAASTVTRFVDLAVEDLDADGDLDLLAAHTSTSGGLTAFLNDGEDLDEDGDLDAMAWSPITYPVSPVASVAAGDGDFDEVAELLGSDDVCHLRHRDLSHPACQDVSGASEEFASLAGGDLDGDLVPDLVFAVDGPGGAEFGWLRNVPRPCDDGFDNDGDTRADATDPGCSAKTDLSELTPLLACDDGADNDGDGFTDYPEDPGCASSKGNRESPQCQDGIDNDGDGTLDFDGGASIHGSPQGDPDAVCQGRPWVNSEVVQQKTCGLGFELGLAVPLLFWLRSRRRARR